MPLRCAANLTRIAPRLKQLVKFPQPGNFAKTRFGQDGTNQIALRV